MKQREIYSCAQMMELIQEVGFLPLLDSGIWDIRQRRWWLTSAAM